MAQRRTYGRADRSFDSKMVDLGRRLGMIMTSGNTVSLAYATVGAVDEEAHTMDAVMDDGNIIRGISLDIVRNGNNSVLILPAVGSTVVIGFVENRPELSYVAAYTAADKILITVGDETGLQFTEGGFTMIRGNSGLKKTLSDLCDAVGSLTVTTGTGPSGIPINKAQFDAIKQDLDNYMEG